MLVHHTRKQNADDKFDMISGTSGLLGAADGAFLLQKEKRTGNAATLEVSGRDQQDQKLYLIRNTETLLWDLQKAETELWKEPPEPLLDEIAELVMKDNPYWEGSPTALVALINMDIHDKAPFIVGVAAGTVKHPQATFDYSFLVVKVDYICHGFRKSNIE